jgi:hypothetical protein
MPVSARTRGPVENRLLAALPSDEYERLLPRLEPVSSSLGEVVYEFGGHLDYVFFPTNSIVSLLYARENGASAEMGLTGSDGRVGIAHCKMNSRRAASSSQAHEPKITRLKVEPFSTISALTRALPTSCAASGCRSKRA